MGRLIYTAIASLDGFVEDEEGSFDWAAPDEEVHAFVNELERPAGSYLYGRRMYETMAGWETDPGLAEASPVMREFAELWRAADKIVYSRTLRDVPTQRTRVEREFDPAAVRELKSAAERDLSIGGPQLAAHALTAGLVDELHLFVAPVLVGRGKRWLPDGLRVRLVLLEQRRFRSGMVYVGYRSAGA